MKFKFKADCIFGASDLDNAFMTIAKHFIAMSVGGDFDMIEDGFVELHPITDNKNSNPTKEKLIHEPVLTKDETAGVVYLKCAFCGKLLWYPKPEETCEAPHELPALKIDVSENIGTEDIFG